MTTAVRNRPLYRQRVAQGALAQRGNQPGMAWMPAPVGGWNARDAWSVLPPTDAPLLDNFILDGGALRVRPGVKKFSDSFIGNAPTLHVFDAGGSSKLIVTGADLWDITSGTKSMIATTEISFATSTMAFNNLVITGPERRVYIYDGTTFAVSTVTGVDQDDLIFPLLFKSRLFFIEKDTLSFWYNGTLSAVNGAYSKFDLSNVAQRGGVLMGIFRLSQSDQGSGADDLLAALTSQGELIVYQGSDPGDATNWALVGIYNVSPPVRAYPATPHNFCAATTIGSNIFVICEGGYVNLLGAMTAPLDSATAYISDTIRPEVRKLVAEAAPVVRLVEYDPAHNWLWFAMPRAGVVDEMHVYDIDHGVWYRFYTAFSPRSMQYYNGHMYLLRLVDGLTYEARRFEDTAYDDNGVAITCEWITAPTYGDNPFAEKRFSAIELEASSDGALSEVTITAAPNFEPPQRGTLSTENPGTPGSWSLYKWDATEWAENRPVGYLYRHGTDIIGRSAMARVSMAVRNRPDLRIHGLRWLYEPAAPGSAASR